jgi:uncharacterized protein
MDGPTTRLRLRVNPGSRQSAIVGRHGDAWKLRVTAPADAGKANDAVLDLLARTLDVSRQSVRLATGEAGRDKIVILEGVSKAEAESKLAAAAGSGR